MKKYKIKHKIVNCEKIESVTLHYFCLCCYFEGLFRLELLYELFNKEKREIDVEPVRLLNVNLCYNSLRQIDARNDTRKHIVLDISTQEALFSVFRQVSICKLGDV